MTVPSPMDEVRAQYEALPYPPRDPRDEAIRLITGTPSHILEINHYLFSGRLNFTRPFRALVAGGGTGDACIMLAQQLADRRCPGEVVYLDLSTASRQICEGRAKARGLRNINFLTGSLLDLPSMPIGQFDYIDCTGVLHHLPDPAAGMRALAERAAARRRHRRDALWRVWPERRLSPAGAAANAGAAVDGAGRPDRHDQAADPLPADHQPVPPQSLSQRPRHRRRRRPLRPAAAQLRPRLHRARDRHHGARRPACASSPSSSRCATSPRPT